MVYKLNPLVVRLDFERRMYRLDDTIKASVTLVPNGSVTVRWASLNLLAQTRHTEVRMGQSMYVGIGDFLYPSDHVRLEDTKHTPLERFMQVKTGTAVCYGAKFLSAASLRNGRPGTFDVELEIGPHLPDIVLDAMERRRDANNSLFIERWWLEVTVYVVLGRNLSVREEIDVSLP